MTTVLNRTTLELLTSVSGSEYSIVDYIRKPDLSAVVGVPSKYWNIVGDTISEKTQSEKDAVDAANLGSLKRERLSKIDDRTEELIAAGFEIPVGSGKIHSLSDRAQLKINATYMNKDTQSYPIVWNTIDNENEISLSGVTAVTDCWVAMTDTLAGHRATDSALKKSIRDAVDTSAVNNIADSR